MLPACESAKQADLLWVNESRVSWSLKKPLKCVIRPVRMQWFTPAVMQDAAPQFQPLKPAPVTWKNKTMVHKVQRWVTCFRNYWPKLVFFTSFPKTSRVHLTELFVSFTKRFSRCCSHLGTVHFGLAVLIIPHDSLLEPFWPLPHITSPSQ